MSQLSTLGGLCTTPVTFIYGHLLARGIQQFNMKTLHVCDYIIYFFDIFVSNVYIFFLLWICALIGAPQNVFPITSSHFASPSSPNSPSRGVSNFQFSSFYQFSAIDATSAIDYSKDVEVNGGIVDNPPAKVVNLTYVLSPSSLYKIETSTYRCETPHHLRMTKTLIKGPTCVFAWRLPHATFPSTPFFVPQT